MTAIGIVFGVVFVLVAALTYLDSSYGLAALVAVQYFLVPRPKILGAYVQPADVAFLGMCVGLLILWRVQRERFLLRVQEFRQHWRETPATGLLLLLVAGVGSVVLSPWVGRALIKWVQLVEFVALFAVAWVTAEPRKTMRAVFATMLAMSLFEGVLTFFQFLNERGYAMAGGGLRPTGTLNNYLATHMVTVFLLALAFAFGWKLQDRRRWAFVIVSGIALTTIALTQVRSILPSLLLGWILVAVGALRRKLPLRQMALLVVSILLVSGLAFGLLAAGQAVAHNSEQMPVENKEPSPLRNPGTDPAPARKLDPVAGYKSSLAARGSSTLKVRLVLWTIASRMLVTHPLLGVGPGQFGGQLQDYATQAQQEFLRPFQLSTEIDAHSALFTILAEEGLLGLLAWAWIWFAILRHAWDLEFRSGRTPPASLLALWVVMAVAAVTFLFSGMLGGRTIWILIGVLEAEYWSQRAAIPASGKGVAAP